MGSIILSAFNYGYLQAKSDYPKCPRNIDAEQKTHPPSCYSPLQRQWFHDGYRAYCKEKPNGPLPPNWTRK